MKSFLYSILFFLIFGISNAYSQDKLFLRNDSIIHCKIISISGKIISYRDSLKSSIKSIDKEKVLIAEFKTGEIYIFSADKNNEFSDSLTKVETPSERKERRMKEWKQKEALWSNNLFGVYPTQLIVGRATVSYERLFANKSIGINVPFSLTFNPSSVYRFVNSTTSTSSASNTPANNNNPDPPKGTGFITGIDVNYYHDVDAELKYYFGPRFRYGTDVLMGNIEGLTFQIQNGLMVTSGEHFASNIGFGVGFFKFSSKYAGTPGFDPARLYPWMSVTWRLCYRL